MNVSRDDAAPARLLDRLRRELESMGDGDFLVVREPADEPPATARRGLFRRRPKPAPSRYVQYRVAEEWIYGECVGSASFGGDWPATPQQHDAVRAAGWLAPGDDDPTQTQPAYPNYWRTVPVGQAAELAAMGVAALEALGADTATVEVEGGHV